MPIIGNLPNNLANGTTADASQVMGNLNYIVNQVNANTIPIGTLTAPTGTSVPMAQSAAPAGWTSSTQSDIAFRYNSSTGGASGGTNGWSTWNSTGNYNANAVTLSVGNLPAHNHTVTDNGHAHTDSGHTHAQNASTVLNIASSGAQTGGSFNIGTGNVNTQTGFANIQSSTTGITINNTGSGTAFTPTVPLPNVKYVDHILAVKS
ncbi:MAG: hypothetical protein ACTHJ9_17345 [Rhodanobacter sp.]